jgi:hypothetical protein
VLSEVLGLDLEITESEGAVGEFWVDLVGRDLGSGRVLNITGEPSSCCAPNSEIEKEMGQVLSWEELPKARARRIAVYTGGQ